MQSQELRLLIIDNVLQKKARCFVFDCLLRMKLHVSHLGIIFNHLTITLKL